MIILYVIAYVLVPLITWGIIAYFAPDFMDAGWGDEDGAVVCFFCSVLWPLTLLVLCLGGLAFAIMWPVIWAKDAGEKRKQARAENADGN